MSIAKDYDSVSRWRYFQIKLPNVAMSLPLIITVSDPVSKHAIWSIGNALILFPPWYFELVLLLGVEGG